jgi:hypothetical protein
MTFLGAVLALGWSEALSQTVLPKSARPHAGEFGVRAVTVKAAAFLERAGLPRYDFHKAQALIDNSPAYGRHWKIYAGPYYFELDPRNGNLISFSNEGRIRDHYLGRGRTGQVAFKNSKERRQYLVKMAIALGMPPSSHITRMIPAAGDNVLDPNRMGGVGIGMLDDKTRLACTLSCDLQDGAVTMFLIWHKETITSPRMFKGSQSKGQYQFR